MLQDLRFGFRTLSRSKLFTLAAILTLALGIGANTAIFSAIDDALLRPLLVPSPNQLVAIYSYSRATSKYLSSSYPDYQDFALRSKSFQALSAYLRLTMNVAFGETTEHLPVEAVTPNYFSMLGLRPLAGRDLNPAGAPSAGLPEALISENLWRTRFAADPGILHRAITLERQPFNIIGIVPRSYRGTNLSWSELRKFGFRSDLLNWRSLASGRSIFSKLARCASC